MKGKARGSGYFRFSDLIIIIVFLSIAAFSLAMFRRDLLQTFTLRNVEPVGTVVIKKNTVQRRISDRVLWDRLVSESPVYIGDLIRVAEISAATLYIDDNSIDLEENTLIRIILAADGESLQLELSGGTLSLATGTQGRSVGLSINGRQVQAAPNTVVSAGVSETGGIVVQVNEGNAQIVEADGTARQISSGTVLAVDADGTEQPLRSAVVTRPVPNARYVKPAKEPLTVNFSWNRINLSPDEKLRLEIASDRKFTHISGVLENLDSQAQAQIDTGSWYWRLLCDDTVLTMGSLTAVDGSGPELQSPAFNSIFRYRNELPVLNFQWAAVEEAVSYIIEVSRTHDFSNPQIRSLSSTASLQESTLGEGSWFWRVMPVFPMPFSGSAAFSTASFFRIEQLPAAALETAGELSLSQWLAAQAPSDELPEGFPPELIPPHLLKSPERIPPPASTSLATTPPAPSSQPQQTPQQQIPPLASPQNLRPIRGSLFGLQDFRTQRSIAFSWTAVQGADAYIFTLYQQAAAGRQRIVRQTINSGTGYTLTDLQLLDRGNFIWQVEPVSMERGGAIDRRGAPGESAFTIDFPSSAPLHIEYAGIINDD